MATTLLLAGGLFLAGCKTQKVESGTESTAPQASLFTVPKEQLAHLRITPAVATTWSIAIHTTGTVDWDADHTTQAITQVNGPISRILVDTGSVVKAGDPLLYVTSPDVANAIAVYRKARNQEDLAKRTLQRTQLLFEHGANAQKDLEAAQAAFNDSASDVQNSLQALKVLGITEQEIEQAQRQGTAISPELAVRAPLAGAIVQKLVMPGQLVQAGSTVCFVLSDVSTVWVQGHIFDRDLLSVRVGDPVAENNPSIHQSFEGAVSYIGAMVDAATRTTPVRIVTRNPGGSLKKDMFVDAVIHTRTRKNVLTVPVSAVLRDAQNEPFVYVEVEPGKFAQRLITTGDEQNNIVEILSGVKEGENVVADGAIFLQFANGDR
jgi:cobalt-zinc-cadmium efflux system membrane fusion protein